MECIYDFPFQWLLVHHSWIADSLQQPISILAVVYIYKKNNVSVSLLQRTVQQLKLYKVAAHSTNLIWWESLPEQQKIPIKDYSTVYLW